MTKATAPPARRSATAAAIACSSESQTRRDGALLVRARSLLSVHCTSQVRQVFGRLVQDNRGRTSNEASDEDNASSVSQDKVNTQPSPDDEALDPVDVLGIQQRSARLLRTVSDNLHHHEVSKTPPESHESRPRVRILYRDEAIRAHFCENAQQLIDLVQSDPNTKTTSAFIAKKALRFRRVSLARVGQVDTRDPTFDVSSFFGVEWCKA